MREVAEAKKPTLREVVIDRFERGPLVGTPAGPIPDTAGAGGARSGRGLRGVGLSHCQEGPVQRLGRLTRPLPV